MMLWMPFRIDAPKEPRSRDEVSCLLANVEKGTWVLAEWRCDATWNWDGSWCRHEDLAQHWTHWCAVTLPGAL